MGRSHVYNSPDAPREKPSVAEIRAAARQRADELRGLPRQVVGAEFLKLREEIRQEMIAKGTATEEEVCDA